MLYVVRINDDEYDDNYNEVVLGIKMDENDVHGFSRYGPLFNIGSKISPQKPLIFDSGSNNFKLDDKYLDLDYFTANPMLVSTRFAELLKTYCCNQIELMDAIIEFTGGQRSGYFAVNILNIVDAIDFNKSSIYRMLPSDPASPLMIIEAVFNDMVLSGVQIAVAAQAPGIIVASENFVKICKENNIRGIEFWPNGKPPP